MKPEPNVASARWLSHYERLDRKDEPFPRVAFEFQPRRFGGSFGWSDLPQRRPGLSRLAREVLLADASRNFRLESAVLGLVSLVCAWPIAIMIGEVIRLLK
jgi:hypothetical protein